MSAEGGPVKIAFVGDVMLGRLVSRELHRRPPDSFWSDVGPLLRSCDAVVANLECAITTERQKWPYSPKTFHFRADPVAVDVLKAGNIRAVSLANNHVLDFGFAGLKDTLRLLDEAGIAHAGAGTDAAAARQPALFSAGSSKVALFSSVDHEPPFAADRDRPGTVFIDLEAKNPLLFPDAAEIARVRREGAALVVLATHFGPNMVLRPSRTIAQYRRAAAALGIDVVFGHSAHLVQGIEQCKRSLVLHDAGDFLDDYAVDSELHNDWSFVFLVEAVAEHLRKLTLVPVRLEFACVRLATEAEAEPLLERTLKLSAAFGTHLTRIGHTLTLDLAAGPPRPG